MLDGLPNLESLTVLDPVLVPVEPSAANVKDPEEETFDHWVAVEGSGFEQCAEHDARLVFARSVVKPSSISRNSFKRTKSKIMHPASVMTRSQTRARMRSKTDRLLF